jgi:hypothetical protein
MVKDSKSLKLRRLYKFHATFQMPSHLEQPEIVNADDPGSENALHPWQLSHNDAPALPASSLELVIYCVRSPEFSINTTAEHK